MSVQWRSSTWSTGSRVIRGCLDLRIRDSATPMLCSSVRAPRNHSTDPAAEESSRMVEPQIRRTKSERVQNGRAPSLPTLMAAAV